MQNLGPSSKERMGERYRTLSAVFPVIIKDNKILLSCRMNTGYMDGKWDFAASGHVDEGETAVSAVIHECKEELGIDVLAHDVEFCHMTHRLGINGARTYYDLYFYVKNYSGIPTVAEPDKCSGLEWFDISSLPEGTIRLRSEALSLILKGVPYSENLVDGNLEEG